MKKQKENNNLYVENPTVEYQQSQEQQINNKRVESYSKKVSPYYEKKESVNKLVDPYDERQDAYNNNEQPSYENEAPFNNNEQPSYDKIELNINDEDLYGEKDDSYNNNEEEFYANEKEFGNGEEEPYNYKEEARAKQIKAYSNPFIVAAFIYVFWPAGLYCMWKYKVFSKPVRIVLSIVMPISGTYRIVNSFLN